MKQKEQLDYGITCENCNQVYVGQTSREPHNRFTEHRATVWKRQSCPASDHFNYVCPDVHHLKITPFEHVPLETERDRRDFNSSNILNRLSYWSETKSEHVSILKCEQKRIKKLKSKKPYGMNKRRELPPSIILSLFKTCG